MNVSHLVDAKYKGQPVSHHRMLNDDPVEGIIASGYLRKQAGISDNIHIKTKAYHGVLVLSGSGRYEDANQSFQLKAGDYVQRLPGLTHSTYIDSNDFSEIYVVLGKSLYKDLSKIHVLSDHSPVLRPGIDYETIQMLLHIQDQLSFVDCFELPLLVPQLIAYLTRITYLDKTQKRTSDETEILSIAASFINQHIDQRISGEDVAKHVNLGYEKFRKLFTSHYQTSPGNYIIHKRIQRSQVLLSNGKSTISEVAYHLGYQDTPSFSKQFKKITGRTPSDFQKLFLDL